MMLKARYPLQDVFSILDAGGPDRVWFSAPPRSISAVLKVFQTESSGPSDPEDAKGFILQGIRSLREENFVRTVVMWNDASCLGDEYGVIYKNLGWYVKFRIDEDGDLDEISFHVPERQLKTVGGLIVPTGGKII
jgi:hypothetical protein